MQPYRLFQAEEEVHVVDCLAARSLQQVVYHRNDQQLVFLFVFTTCFRSGFLSVMKVKE